MSVSIPDDILGLTEANAELDRLEAADESKEQGAGSSKPDPNKESATEEATRAGQAEDDTQVDPNKAKTAESGEQGAGSSKPDPNQDQKTKEKPDQKSRYAKAVERQEKSWLELNAQKELLKREREEFDRAKAEHEAAQAKAEFSPEAYDEAAKKFEEAGKFDLAELAREKAAELRKNPPTSVGAKADAQEPARKEWALKAGVDFPELAKTNSPMQVRVAQLLKEEPDLKAHPKGIYMAARLADLEQRAAGVEGKDKELDQLRAKVKELEGLTAPGGPGSAAALPAAKTFEQLDDTEQFEQLRQQAQELGSLR